MTVDKVFFLLFFFVTFIYAIYVGFDLFKHRNKIKETEATIINVELAHSPGLPHINAKLATFVYFVDKKKYISKNSIKMNLSTEIGDVKMVNYFIDNPNILYKVNITNFYIASITSIICLLIGIFM